MSVLAGIWGVLLVIYTLSAAIRSFVLPRADNVPLTRWVFSAVYAVFRFRMKFQKNTNYKKQDELMAMFAPIALIIIPAIWLILIMFGYACIYWALDVRPFYAALTLSGSSLLTLGTVPFVATHITLIEFSEAMIGLGLVALLISYLPTMYAAFSRREAQVMMLEVRAGSPPSAVEWLLRLHRIRGLDVAYINATWAQWEVWFTELEESHTTFLPLVFFRSSKSEQSWVTAAGTILDAAALISSTIDIPQNAQSQLTIRAGYIALRKIADLLQIEYDPNPSATDPISIMKEEFYEVYGALKEQGLPLRADREQCWRDFAGWRVNYDRVLLQLAAFTMAPYAPWVSDRSLPHWVKPHKRH